MEDRSTSRRSFERLLAQVRLAEECGLTAVWCLPSIDEAGDFARSAPELWLSALASATDRIRLGWGLSGMTPPDRPPIGIAEQAASLDLASQGRLDIAFLPDGEGVDETGSGSSGWDEGVRMLVEMWDAARFSWSSARFELKPIDVVPKPVQKPHPPLWLVGWSAEHAARAGTHGLGFLDVSGTTDEGLELHRRRYLESRASAEVHDLVCESAFAAGLDLPANEVANGVAAVDPIVRRLADWENMGIDQAVARVGWPDQGHEQTLTWIRRFAEADGMGGEHARERPARDS